MIRPFSDRDAPVGAPAADGRSDRRATASAGLDADRLRIDAAGGLGEQPAVTLLAQDRQLVAGQVRSGSSEMTCARVSTMSIGEPPSLA
jgi:hypothetical protein